MISFGVGMVACAPAVPTESLVEGNTAFALNLYTRLSDTPGNLFFSPYSLSTCMAMTYAGARGETETQMSQVLHFSTDQHQLHSAFGELQRQLHNAEKQDGIQLDIANALWTRKGEPFLASFLKIAKNDYQASVNQADFQTEAEVVTREINRWVAQKTRDKIPDILSPDSVNRDTGLVLANAVYFKGTWASQFKTAATSIQPFHLSAIETRGASAPLMCQLEDVNFTENNDLQAVELPYNGDQLSMMILLPRQIDALGKLEQQLSPAFFARILAQMTKEKVEIFLPKFKLQSGFTLNDTLMKMGMTNAFSPLNADFSGLNGRSGDLFISGVFHKAWVKVDEEGTEAAAATIVVAERALARPSPPVFRADHPFIFLIRDTRSGSVLFLGRLADPRE